MQFAVLCAFVFGALTVAGSSVPLNRNNDHYENDADSSDSWVLQKRQVDGVAEAFAHAFPHIGPEAEEAAHVANPAARGSTSYIYNEALRVPQGAPAGAVDNAMMEKILKNQKKLKTLYEQDREAAQLHQVQALRAAEETNAAKQVAAAPVAKSGGSWTKTKIAGGLIVGGLGGYGITKMLTTTPADSTTQYNPNDTAALNAAGGSAVPSAANAPAAGAGASYGPGVYTDPKTGAQYSVDAAGNVSLVPSAGAAGGNAGIGAAPAVGANALPSNPAGNAGMTNPATGEAAGATAPTNGPGLYMDRTNGLQYYVDATGKVTPAGTAGAGTAEAIPSMSAAGTTTSSTTGTVAGSNIGSTPGASGAQQLNAAPAGAIAPASGTSAADATGGQTIATAAVGSTAAQQPQWDASMNMYYVMSQDGTPYYIEPTSHMLINGKTGQIVDPQTGQVVDPNTLGASTAEGSSSTLGGKSSTSDATDSPPAKDPQDDGKPKSDPSSNSVPATSVASDTKPPTTGSSSEKAAGGNAGSSSGLQKRFIRKRQV